MTQYIREQTGIVQELLAGLLNITRQQLSMSELDERTLPAGSSLRLLPLYTTLQHLPPMPEAALEERWTASRFRYQNRLHKTFYEVTTQQKNLQQKLASSKLAFTKATRLWQWCDQLEKHPDFNTEKDRLVFAAAKAEAEVKLRKHNRYAHLEMETQLQILNLQLQLLQQQIDALEQKG